MGAQMGPSAFAIETKCVQENALVSNWAQLHRSRTSKKHLHHIWVRDRTEKETELTLGLTGKKVLRDYRHTHNDRGMVKLVEHG